MLPSQSEGNLDDPQLDSILQALPLHHYEVEMQCLSSELAEIFAQYPMLPGAILVRSGQMVGMLSRQRFLECLIRPFGMEILLKQPLETLYGYARADMLMLPGKTPIVAAAQQALRRSPLNVGEPIVVKIDQSYHLLDMHVLNIAYWQIRGIETQVRYERAQVQMIQRDKMANLGRLVDGVAHEILDPVSFIWGNLSHVTTYVNDLLALLKEYETQVPNPAPALKQLRESMEVEYLCEDLPQAIDSIRTGADRLSKLATGLQNFCHVDEVYPKPIDLHSYLDGIVLLLKSRLSSEIQVIRYYGHLPPVSCYPGQLNQVLMNLLSTAVDHLLDMAVGQDVDINPRPEDCAKFKPTIEITTQVRSLPTPTGGDNRWVSICIADNGSDLSPAMQTQLMESFSVQRRAEKETSLAMSYQIITAKHGGKFEVRSRRYNPNADSESTGTEFEILLPL
jgi:signal transduction histidine kinase